MDWRRNSQATDTRSSSGGASRRLQTARRSTKAGGSATSASTSTTPPTASVRCASRFRPILPPSKCPSKCAYAPLFLGSGRTQFLDPRRSCLFVVSASSRYLCNNTKPAGERTRGGEHCLSVRLAWLSELKDIRFFNLRRPVPSFWSFFSLFTRVVFLFAKSRQIQS